MTKNNPQTYIPRLAESALSEALNDTPVVCLLGPRQCGKSTLARHHSPDRHYISLDDQNVLNLAKDDPQGFVAELPERVTIDEIQRAPELMLAIKRSVDGNRQAGRFLLTGSANLLLLPRLADSLAGRMEIVELQPFTEAEKIGAPGLFLEKWTTGKLKSVLAPTRDLVPSSLPKRLIAGGYPEAFKRPPKRARQWLKQYTRMIIERDIRDISQIREGADMMRFVEYLSHQNGQLLNITSIANALGHTRNTIDKYITILEKLFLIRRLPAWHRNEAKRLIKTPKLHFRDCGLTASLSGIKEAMWLDDRSRFGSLLESFVVQHITIQAQNLDESFRLYHYRDKDKVEVDCVLTEGRNIWGIEVKAANTILRKDAKGLRRLADQTGKDFQGGILFYDGTSILPLDKKLKLFAVPISQLWES